MQRLPRLDTGNVEHGPADLRLLLLLGPRSDAGQAPPPPPLGASPMVQDPRPAPRGVVLEDVVETDPRYIIGISYPPEVNRYPGLAAELRDYSEAARQDLMDAVAAMGDEPGGLLYDLALEYKVVADTPEIFAVAADGGTFTGGAHGAPLIARFVWLPREDRLLTADALVPTPRPGTASPPTRANSCTRRCRSGWTPTSSSPSSACAWCGRPAG